MWAFSLSPSLSRWWVFLFSSLAFLFQLHFLSVIYVFLLFIDIIMCFYNGISSNVCYTSVSFITHTLYFTVFILFLSSVFPHFFSLPLPRLCFRFLLCYSFCNLLVFIRLKAGNSLNFFLAHLQPYKCFVDIIHMKYLPISSTYIRVLSHSRSAHIWTCGILWSIQTKSRRLGNIFIKYCVWVWMQCEKYPEKKMNSLSRNMQYRRLHYYMNCTYLYVWWNRSQWKWARGSKRKGDRKDRYWSMYNIYIYWNLFPKCRHKY